MMINPNSEDAYPADDVVIARERVKLAQLYVSLGDAQRCRDLLKIAERDMQPFVTTDDPDWIEI
eukprot:CAMPEP_0119053322 /NCGR_PEP_ID=MMETSP1177-20130426/74355_1 /TAXON_ID=2985 /ORGANISM="Ochromonas sp, Strain CCMP1899" /LENGTH=63 /DNA_ID=CAMNT_0007033247 /DNA_START=2070 /DNA_END=2258 /DNA_ORIENTATION=+